MGRAGKSRQQRRLRAAARLRAQDAFPRVPHSLVLHRGRPGRSVRQLERDLRRVMEPYTARALRVRKRNSLRDFVAVAGPLGVTHFLVLSKTLHSINLKIFRLPGGPTLTFKVTQYALVRDVVAAQRRHRMHEQQFLQPPLLVLSNLGQPHMHVKLTATVLQNMFPSINVHQVNLNSVKRCLLVNYDADSQLLDLRHYSIKVVPVGVSRGLKKLLQEKFPNMGRLEDISELLVRDINLSESEAEQDGSHNTLELPQACAGRGNMRAQQSAVRLTEIGPRLTLQLVKVEEGLGQGNVLYHRFVHKTDAELQELLARREEKLRLRSERRRKQQEDVERKRRQREAHRKKSLAGMGRDGDSDAEDPGAPEQPEAADASSSDGSDAEYYRQELGEEPDEDLFPRKSGKRKRGPAGSAPLRKRRPERPGKSGTSGSGHRDSRPRGRLGRGRGSRRMLPSAGLAGAQGTTRMFRRPGRGRGGKR